MTKAKKTHQPCPTCGSSDALSIYEDGTYCFSCNTVIKNGIEMHINEYKVKNPVLNSNLTTGKTKELSKRKLSSETCLKYGVTVSDASKHIYPYYDKWNQHVANKVRGKNKVFSVEGQISDATLFGQQLFKKSGKYITICEGELDAMSAHQMFDSKWPCVSVKTGAASAHKDIVDNYDYLMSFDNIVICFDNDKVGLENAKAIAEVLSPKAKIMKMRYKDASAYLMENKLTEFVSDWWNADTHTPDGIVAGSQLWEVLSEGPKEAVVDYPFEGLNRMTYGVRKGELVTICAGTGIGKSSFLREIIYLIYNKTDENIVLMFM